MTCLCSGGLNGVLHWPAPGLAAAVLDLAPCGHDCRVLGSQPAPSAGWQMECSGWQESLERCLPPRVPFCVLLTWRTSLLKSVSPGPHRPTYASFLTLQVDQAVLA